MICGQKYLLICYCHLPLRCRDHFSNPSLRFIQSLLQTLDLHNMPGCKVKNLKSMQQPQPSTKSSFASQHKFASCGMGCYCGMVAPQCALCEKLGQLAALWSGRHPQTSHALHECQSPVSACTKIVSATFQCCHWNGSVTTASQMLFEKADLVIPLYVDQTAGRGIPALP